MNASDAVAEIESRYPCLQGPHRAICQTGELYVEIGFECPSVGAGSFHDRVVPGVIRPMMPRQRYATEEDAAEGFLAAFAMYEASWRLRRRLVNDTRAPIVYWRYDPPHCFWYPEDRALKCRLVLSNRPVVAITDADYDAARTAELEGLVEHS